MTFLSPEEFFENLMIGIDLNVRECEQLEPMFAIQSFEGAVSFLPAGPFFASDRSKDYVLSFINRIFKSEQVAMIAMIAECWVADAGTEEEQEAFRASGRSVSELSHKTSNVMVSVYTRDMKDMMYGLKIKPDRKGVEKMLAVSAVESSGRFVRRRPDDN